MESRVDFPEPEGPRIATNSPASTLRLSPLGTWWISSPSA